jgi:ATP-dependent Clp endopeptidase proteolytic subunit ClpP
MKAITPLEHILKPSSPWIYINGKPYEAASLLYQHRIIKLGRPIESSSVASTVSQLIHLDMLGHNGRKNADITLYIDSPGGSYYEGMDILETIALIKSRVIGVCSGIAMSMASIILASLSKGNRYAMPRSTIMVHCTSFGNTEYIKHPHLLNLAEESKRIAEIIKNIYVENCAFDEEGNCRWNNFVNDKQHGLVIYDQHLDNGIRTKEDAKEWLEQWWNHNRYMDAELALKWGHIDKIIKNKE